MWPLQRGGVPGCERQHVLQALSAWSLPRSRRCFNKISAAKSDLYHSQHANMFQKYPKVVTLHSGFKHALSSPYVPHHHSFFVLSQGLGRVSPRFHRMHKVPPGHFNLQCRCGIASWLRMHRRHHRHGDVGQHFWWQFRPRSGSLRAMQWRFTLPPWIKPYIIEDRRVDCGRRIRSKASERIFQHGRKAHWSFQMPELRALPWRHAWTVCRWTWSDFDSLCRLSSGDIVEWWWVCCLLWWCRCHVVPLADAT